LATPAALTPYLAPDVGEIIAAENARHGGAVEITWCAKWDAERERASSARLLFRGNNASAPMASRDVAPGEVHIHNHAVHFPIYPSEQDLKTAKELAEFGAGMLILSHDCREGYLVRAPLAARNYPPPKVWTFGRFMLMHFRGGK
jgi:hypothetical protein